MKNENNIFRFTLVFLFVIVMALSLSYGCGSCPSGSTDCTSTTTSTSSTTSSTTTSTTTTTQCDPVKETKCTKAPTTECCKIGETKCRHFDGKCVTTCDPAFGVVACGPNDCVTSEKDDDECCVWGAAPDYSYKPYAPSTQCCDGNRGAPNYGSGVYPSGDSHCPGVTPTTAPTLKCSGAAPCKADCYESGGNCYSCCGADSGNPNPSECNDKAYADCPTSTSTESHCVWDFAGLHFSQCPT